MNVPTPFHEADRLSFTSRPIHGFSADPCALEAAGVEAGGGERVSAWSSHAALRVSATRKETGYIRTRQKSHLKIRLSSNPWGAGLVPMCFDHSPYVLRCTWTLKLDPPTHPPHHFRATPLARGTWTLKPPPKESGSFQGNMAMCQKPG